MGLQIFNTLSRSLEPFIPLDPEGKRVGVYCCGPTVHNFAHIGNFRTFVFADLVRRYLEWKGYEVRHVMNVTDVEDKIIAAAQREGITAEEHTGRYERAFFEDFEALRCVRPHEVPHATDHIKQIIELIQRLQERGIAYQAPDGSVYFSIEQYQKTGRKYGRLLTLNLEQLRSGERVQADEYDKESAVDFSLWKARVEADGAVFWPSPWGDGRPGWHIECSAMSMALLGPSFDLHLGGEDLIFPHHEDEIAQSEGAEVQEAGKSFVKYWMHGAHFLVEGKKMAKSLGNFFTLRDLLDKGYGGREIRYLLVSAHYRESFNFTLEGLAGARSAMQRIDECVAKLGEVAGGEAGKAEPDVELVKRWEEAMDNDFNVAAAWGVVFEWVREMNKRMGGDGLGKEEAARALAGWRRINEVLAVEAEAEEGAPAALTALLAARQEARKAKDFKKADSIRDELAAHGWLIEDTPKGPRLKKA